VMCPFRSQRSDAEGFIHATAGSVPRLARAQERRNVCIAVYSQPVALHAAVLQASKPTEVAVGSVASDSGIAGQRRIKLHTDGHRYHRRCKRSPAQATAPLHRATPLSLRA
jgi:hypothetical protein